MKLFRRGLKNRYHLLAGTTSTLLRWCYKLQPLRKTILTNDSVEKNPALNQIKNYLTGLTKEDLQTVEKSIGLKSVFNINVGRKIIYLTHEICDYHNVSN